MVVLGGAVKWGQWLGRSSTACPPDGASAIARVSEALTVRVEVTMGVACGAPEGVPSA
jgi:hypothetical protein